MIEDYINLITAWAKTRGYSVFGKWDEDAFYDKDKEIVYSLRTKEKKNQMYSLLHECGHALAFESKGYKNRFPTMSKRRFKTAKVNSRTNTFKVEQIIEERRAANTRLEELVNALEQFNDIDEESAHEEREQLEMRIHRVESHVDNLTKELEMLDK